MHAIACLLASALRDGCWQSNRAKVLHLRRRSCLSSSRQRSWEGPQSVSRGLRQKRGCRLLLLRDLPCLGSRAAHSPFCTWDCAALRRFFASVCMSTKRQPQKHMVSYIQRTGAVRCTKMHHACHMYVDCFGLLCWLLATCPGVSSSVGLECGMHFHKLTLNSHDLAISFGQGARCH